MKRNRKTAAVLAGFIMMALMMVSCNESNSYRELTKQEIQSAFLTVRGYHTGKMVYLKNIGNYQTKTDTVDISWTIDTDSTLTIHNFAVEPYAEFITDNELKEALLQQPYQDVQCKIHFVGLSPVLFYVGVDAPAYNITYGGQNHKVQLAFYGNANSCGVYDVPTQRMEIHLVGGGIYEDGTYKEKYLSTTNIPMLLFTPNK